MLLVTKVSNVHIYAEKVAFSGESFPVFFCHMKLHRNLSWHCCYFSSHCFTFGLQPGREHIAQLIFSICLLKVAREIMSHLYNMQLFVEVRTSVSIKLIGFWDERQHSLGETYQYLGERSCPHLQNESCNRGSTFLQKWW